MNEASVKVKNPNSMGRLTIILLVISAVVALLLGLVNYITKDKIDAYKIENTNKARFAVMATAASFEPVEYAGTDATVSAVSTALDETGAKVGTVVEVAPTGFGGVITMVVGVDNSGAVTGVSIVSMTETSGLGANASKEAFRSQYVGKSGALAVTKDGGEIEALTGATVTSRAVTSGVNSALAAAAAIG